MKITSKILVLLFMTSFAHATPPHRRALVVGWDGARGDVVNHVAFDLNQAPNLRKLMASGVYTTCTSNTDVNCARAHSGARLGHGHQWLTGPGWGSVISGADSDLTQILDNNASSLSKYATTSAQYPTFLQRAKNMGLKTAASGVGAFMTSKYMGGTKYGVIDYECGAKGDHPNVGRDDARSCNLDRRLSLNGSDSGRDEKLTSWLVDQINDSTMDVTMGVFDQVDAAGHAHGFTVNDGYMKAMQAADLQLGKILAAIEVRVQTTDEEWLIVLTADHGGHKTFYGGNHDSKKNEDEVVPFVVATYGKTAPKNLVMRPPVRHMDVHPTVMMWFDQISPHLSSKVQGI